MTIEFKATVEYYKDFSTITEDNATVVLRNDEEDNPRALYIFSITNSDGERIA